MITAGVFTNGRESAAAVAVDGRLRAALNRGGGTENSASLLRQCFDIARVAPQDAGGVVHVGDAESETLGTTRIGRLPAQAALLSAVLPEDALLVLLDAGCAGGAFAEKRDGRLQPLVRWSASVELAALARSTASALGLSPGNPFVSLGALAGESASELDARLSEVLVDQAGGTTGVDAKRFDGLLASVRAECAELDRADSLQLAVQRTRTALASGVLRLVARVASDSIERLRHDRGAGAVGIGGSAFASVPLNSAVISRVSDAVLSPVPEDIGSALGAAISGNSAAAVTHLSLGAAFDEHDIKSALENCRLDYVYEPDWLRLFDRVSGILTAGKTIAWFQGAAEFGPRPLGHRSILCDPSNRYARENVNVYLLGRELNHPIPLSLAPSAAASCLEVPRSSPYMLVSGRVSSRWRDQLQAVVDTDGSAVIHTPAHDSELAKLLEAHLRRRGVPGLMNVPLAGTATWLANDPKDAIRTSFGSAVDALVIGRFLVSKDYWLLRGQTMS